MSKGFEGTKGPWSYTASIPEDGAECFWIVGHDGRDIGAVDGPQTDEREALAGLIAEAGTVLHETGLTPRQLAEECQIHRGAHLGIDQIVMGAGVFEVEVEGGLEPAWENTASAVRQLAESRAELLEALQALFQRCVAELVDPEDVFEMGAAQDAIANASQQRNATGGEG